MAVKVFPSYATSTLEPVMVTFEVNEWAYGSEELKPGPSWKFASEPMGTPLTKRII